MKKILGFLIVSLLAGFSLFAAENTTAPNPPVPDSPTPKIVAANGQIELPENILQELNVQKKDMSIVVGRSQLMKFSRAINRLSISDPEIVDFLVLSPNEILLNAKREGAVNLIIWDFQDALSIFDITVTKDPGLLAEVLKTIDPSGKFEVYPSKDVFVVKGETTSVEKLKLIEKAANAFAEGSVSLVMIKDVKQIMLETRFIQIDRTQNYDFGIDLETSTDNPRNNIFQRVLAGGTNASTSGDSTTSLVTPAVTANIFDRNDDDVYQINWFKNNRDTVQAFVKAIEAKGLGKVIARPNLLAKDGEEASFLVGGEAAVAVATDDSLSVQYKEFGTRLKFTPEILGNGKIKLAIEPEVSELDFANGVEVNNITIPSFSTTRAKTVVEVENGQTFMIGGLIQNRYDTTDTGIPFLRRMPFIGKLFQSLDYNLSRTELLIIITPRLVRPETLAIKDENTETDNLALASHIPPNPIEDNQADAISTYVRTGERKVEPKAETETEKIAKMKAAKKAKTAAVQKAKTSVEKKVETPAEKKSVKTIQAQTLRPVASLPATKPASAKTLDDLEKELQWEKMTGRENRKQ